MAADCHCERSEAISGGMGVPLVVIPAYAENARLDPGSESGVTNDRQDAGPDR